MKDFTIEELEEFTTSMREINDLLDQALNAPQGSLKRRALLHGATKMIEEICEKMRSPEPPSE